MLRRGAVATAYAAALAASPASRAPAPAVHRRKARATKRLQPERNAAIQQRATGEDTSTSRPDSTRLVPAPVVAVDAAKQEDVSASAEGDTHADVPLARMVQVLTRRPAGSFPLSRSRNEASRDSRNGAPSAAPPHVPAVHLLQPTAFVAHARAALQQIILAADGPLSVPDVLKRFQHESTHTGSVADTTTVTMSAETAEEGSPSAGLVAQWIDYAIALQDFMQLCDDAHAGVRGEKAHAEIQGDGGIGRRELLLKSYMRPRIRGEADAKRLALLQSRILQDCAEAPVMSIASLYRSLYRRTLLSLLEESSLADDSGVDAGGGDGQRGEQTSRLQLSPSDIAAARVSRWLPLALLHTDPHFRVVPPRAGSASDTTAAAVTAPPLVCFPVQPSVLMAAMDPLRMPSLRQHVRQAGAGAALNRPLPVTGPMAKATSPLSRRVKPRAAGAQQTTAWTVAASLAHCVDATVALTGQAAPLPLPLSLTARRRVPPQGVMPRLVEAWLRWGAAGSSLDGNPRAVLEEGLGVDASVDTAGATGNITPIARSDAGGGDGNVDDGAFAFPPPLPSAATQPTMRTERRHKDEQSARETTGDNDDDDVSPQAAFPPAAEEEAPTAGNDGGGEERADEETARGGRAGRRHHRSADGKRDELMRRATGWNEAVVGNPVLNAWAWGGGSATAATGDLHRILLTTTQPSRQTMESTLAINRDVLQPLLQAILVTPISLARLSTTLRWNATCRFAPHYHGSLLYFLLLFMGNPTIHRAQEREERQMAVLCLPPRSSTSAAAATGRRCDTKRFLAVCHTSSTADAAGGDHSAGLSESYAESERAVLARLLAQQGRLGKQKGREEEGDDDASGVGARWTRDDVETALRRAAAQRRESLCATMTVPVMTYAHRAPSEEAAGDVAAVPVDALLDALRACPATVGRLLFARLRRTRRSTSDTVKDANGARRSAQEEADASCLHVDVLDADAALPQDTLHQLVVLAKGQQQQQQQQHATPAVLQLLDDNMSEDVMVFPLSRNVFLARVYAVCMRYLQHQHQQQQRLTLGKVADLTLWSVEFGKSVGAELLHVYLARFPDMVRVTPRREAPHSEWEVRFTV